MKLRLLPKTADGGLQFHKESQNLDLCPVAKALLSRDEIVGVYIGKSHITVRKKGIRPW